MAGAGVWERSLVAACWARASLFRRSLLDVRLGFWAGADWEVLLCFWFWTGRGGCVDTWGSDLESSPSGPVSLRNVVNGAVSGFSRDRGSAPVAEGSS